MPFPGRYLVTFFPPWSASYGMPVKNNAMPDVITQIYPWKQIAIESWKRGEIPLWNPYSFSGTAHAANYQSAAFSPMNFLFFLLPMVDAWSLLILFQPLLAGLLMYMFLRSIHRSKEAALIGSISFMFCGFMVVWMAYGTLVYAALWLPLALVGVFRSRGVLLSMSIALSLLSGHFQISVYVAGFVIFAIIWKTVETKRIREGAYLFLFTCIGILIALPQLSLSYDAYVASVRGANVTKGEIIPLQYIATFFAPDYYGNPVTRNDWFGHYAEWAGFIGVVPLILFISVLLRKKTSEEWMFVTTGILALLLAYNTPLADLLYSLKIPVLSTSAASRIIVIASFSFAVLASFGFDNLKKNVLNKTLFLLGLIIAILWFIAFVQKPFPVERTVIAQRNIILPTLMAVMGIGILYLARFNKHMTKIASYILILIVVFDGYRYASKWMPFEERQFVYPQTKTLTYLENTVGTDRMFGNTGGEVANYFSFGSIEGYDALYQERYGKFISAASTGKITYAGRSVVLLGKADMYNQKVLDILGVRYLLQKKGDGRNVWAYPYWNYPQYRLIYEDEQYEVYENTGSLPRAYLASSYEVGSEQKIIDLLFSEGFNLREKIVLEEKPLQEPDVGDGEAAIVTYLPTRVELKTQSQVPKLLFLSDVYDKGWQAFIDKTETKVFRANYDFRAVSVPPGSHVVTFVYWPKPLTRALIISGLSAIFLMGITLKKIYEDRYL